MKRHLTRFLRWRRYRRYLNALLTDELRVGPVGAKRFGELQADAWLAARATGRR